MEPERKNLRDPDGTVALPGVTEDFVVLREQISSAGGREIETTGDGVLAVFDTPVVAIRAATAIRAASHDDGLPVRIGIHVGEVELVGTGIRGLAVHEAARVMGQAGADEIVVSETTKAVAAGTGFVFADRGSVQLKGLGARRLYAVE